MKMGFYEHWKPLSSGNRMTILHSGGPRKEQQAQKRAQRKLLAGSQLSSVLECEGQTQRHPLSPFYTFSAAQLWTQWRHPG